MSGLNILKESGASLFIFQEEGRGKKVVRVILYRN